MNKSKKLYQCSFCQYSFSSNGKRLIHEQKEHPSVIKSCLCDDSDCAKCLSMNCQDKNCLVHTKERKEAWRCRWEEANKRQFPHPKNY